MREANEPLCSQTSPVIHLDVTALNGRKLSPRTKQLRKYVSFMVTKGGKKMSPQTRKLSRFHFSINKRLISTRKMKLIRLPAAHANSVLPWREHKQKPLSLKRCEAPASKWRANKKYGPYRVACRPAEDIVRLVIGAPVQMICYM